MSIQDIFNQNIGDTNPHNILILDDDQISSEALKNLLKELGYSNISIATTVKEAIKLLSQQHFNLLITDYHLPDMKGSEFTKYYRKNSPKLDTPIICCSSDVENYRRECIESGVDDFISKPVTKEKLQELLECWIVVSKQDLHQSNKNKEREIDKIEA